MGKEGNKRHPYSIFLYSVCRVYLILWYKGLTTGEQNVLEAFSMFPYIPLHSEVCSRWLLADAGAGGEDFIVEGLYQKGWLQFDEEQESYLMHPVFAQFIYDRSRPDVNVHQGLMDGCMKSIKIPEDGRITECKKYLPFAEAVIEKIGAGDQESLISGLSETGYLLYYMGEYKKAEELYKKALKSREEVYGEVHPDTAVIYNNLGGIYFMQGKFIEAL